MKTKLIGFFKDDLGSFEALFSKGVMEFALTKEISHFLIKTYERASS